MDTQSLSNVLVVMREMAKGRTGIDTPLAVINRLSGTNAPSEVAVLRIAGHLSEQISLAQQVIESSSMRPEAKAGVSQVLDGLSSAFSITQLQSSYQSRVPNLTGSISNLVILLDAAGIEEPNGVPDEVEALLGEMEDLYQVLQDKELDPVVRKVARQHIEILVTLLRHLPVFGLESALVAYFELMSRVRRAEAGSSEKAKSKFAPIWDQMTKWTGRLNEADKMWNVGAKLIEHGDKVGGFLEYIPL